MKIRREHFLLSCIKLQLDIFSQNADGYELTWLYVTFLFGSERFTSSPSACSVLLYIYVRLVSLCSEYSWGRADCGILGQYSPICRTGRLNLPSCRNSYLTLEPPEDGLSVISACDHCGAQLIHPHGCDSTCVKTIFTMNMCIIIIKYIKTLHFVKLKSFLEPGDELNVGGWAVPECAGILLVTVLLSRSHSRRSPDCPPHNTELPSQQKHLDPHRPQSF